MSDTESSTGIIGTRVLGADFQFTSVANLGWSDGTFDFSESGSMPISGENLWVVPGFVDAHVHLGWTDFSEDDRKKRSSQDLERLIAQNLHSTLTAGFTGARDAGGLSKTWIARGNNGELSSPTISGSIDCITAASAQEAGSIERATERVLSNGASWVKLIATDGISSPSTSLNSHFSASQIRSVVNIATQSGCRVMVHAWGGEAITWAIEAGASSIEHGIFLDDDQARAAAESEVTFVPTLCIYRKVYDMITLGSLPSFLHDRVKYIVDVHPRAVRTAMEHGVKIAVGTDFGSVEQHGSNADELLALLDAGLSPKELLQAATTNGAELLDCRCRTSFLLKERMPADAVIFARNPLESATYADPHAIAAVVKTGRVVTV